MRIPIIAAIAKKDLREVSRNRTAWIPAVIVPLIFFIVLPVGFFLLPRLSIIQSAGMRSNITPQELQAVLPPDIASLFNGLSPEGMIPFAMMGYFFAPMFLIVPLMISSIVSSESFAGEKERKTLEGLLYSPATDTELFIGKLLAAFLPGVGFSLIGFVLYAVVVNILGYPLIGRIWFPLPGWWPLIFWIVPGVALLATSVTVLISARVNTFIEAYQTGGALVVLVIGLIAGQASGAIHLTVRVNMLVGLIIWLIDFVLIRFCLKLFNRHALIGKV